MNIETLLNYLLQLPVGYVWLIFLLENVLITCVVLLIGRFYYKGPYTPKEWTICIITNIINTIVTYAGFWLWKHGIVKITMGVSWNLLLDFLLLFLAMDLLMYVFHIAIHKTFLYKAVHRLHHEAVDPKPIDLFVLHPVEAFGFGSLWLLLLVVYPFNVYAIVIYLMINVIFGLAGHLGIEPIPEKILRLPLIKYLGTSTFHHNHHQDITHNFGFYTSIWDRLFKTYK
ncbi:sterol desaturase family protein [Chitinophaga pinensis]|uniref:Fatty acid hydroxylase n=1 Tax=Chitinophaga pinensis (strain ATCC 43595 / DSM 2588 / LMG 13176 / NBRC 15968 / NCIMB 11800 / UQM 2034) TaxID=485918 RepID=A0A979GRR8_CHIPD|nr:sterol desaturase family protein [Chitinophaga pinensis]ACU58879.1 fatty acid hydroxylase [Chitinophaga pinensis DSM 2588]